MLKYFLSFLILIQVTVFSQTGRITGLVTDLETKEVLVGATILLQGTNKYAQTDFDGKFSLNNIPAGNVNLVISYVSYSTKTVTANVKSNDVTYIPVFLSTRPELAVVEVTVRAITGSVQEAMIEKKNNASASEVMSEQEIKRQPTTNTSDVLKKMAGASIQDNKFAIIRGLNDRYNTAYLNGAPLPSTESDRKAFSFDIFPSNMLDNLTIIKTARPNVPGEFAGGIIEINTKDIPDRNFISVSSQLGYNTITTNKEQQYYRGGRKDWLGYDDGTRSMPKEVPYFDNFPLNIHQQGALAKEIPVSDWSLYTKKFSPNTQFQLAGGYNFKLKKDSNNIRDFFGVLASVSYNKTNNFFTTDRFAYTNNTNPELASDLETVYHDKTYSEQVLSGAMLNMVCKISSNHVIGSKSMLTFNSDDRVVRRSGSPSPQEANPLLIKSYVLWYTANKIQTSQLNGNHYFEKPKIKIGWNAAYTKVERDIPNLRRHVFVRLTDFYDPTYPAEADTTWKAEIAPTSISPDYGGTMLWSKLKEDIRSAKMDISRQFKISEKLKLELKTGALIQDRDRTFDIRQLGYTQYKGGVVKFKDSLLYQPEQNIISTQNMGTLYVDEFGDKAGGFKFIDATKPRDPYRASAELKAAYMMYDLRWKKWLRWVAGARVESYSQKLTYNDQAFLINKKTISKDTTVTDLLPSSNLIFTFKDTLSIRLCYSRTLNRPEFRELAPFAFYDFNTQFVLSGNDTLRRAVIDNFDLRYEVFPGKAQLFSVSGFYKIFTNPIEQVSSLNKNEVSYKNVNRATCAGIELEYRIVLGGLHRNDSSLFGKFLNRLTLFTNYAYISSKVDTKNVTGATDASRPLQGQSPYLVNAGLNYVDTDNHFIISAIANRIGHRIYIVGNYLYPDIWENGRTVIDFQASKYFFKNDRMEVRFSIRDILKQKQYFYQDKNLNKKFDKTSDDLMWIQSYGATYAIQLRYKF